MRKFCIYNIISLLALCFTTTAFAQSYSLTIAGISVNDANCNDVFNDGGSVSYSPSTKTLTFNNFSASNFRKEPYKGGRISIGNTNSQYFQNAYVLHQKDGHVTSISFSEKPVISYSGDELVVTTSTVTVQYPLDFLNKISVEGHVEEVTSIDEVILPDTEFSFSEEGAKVRGEKPGTPFYVFDLRGMKCAQGVIDAEGKANIRLSSLPSGIYIIKTQSTSFKIKK